ncbi:MAG: protein-export membrane protein SecF [Ignavibacteria bacterium GWA2_55_11]|nr:MAG: protein-export membrane protein SecF [Ignavibacteria bacterium GWA2_55_11]OGU44510.1 MAG: protein-export membrane protein SecF [Ignavibacteria bacterium GWC2_56_12]OGU75003.1 MAG: protein-export membrane protein SecF [Ignavibacteria bacterium RIFCSPLOWO2_12_FULL_56_21]OGU75691.1 MAG: protein-export membrane protein SecF [Ignavibacteria bacterium RIFCSPLOWO2_02_FULL_55_14]HAV24238.1 protein translocase subunit SecF [Bacteroidota bacterium]
MRFFKKTNIQFLDFRNVGYFLSSTLIVVGLVSLVSRGISFGIDFLGGTEIVVSFRQPPDIGQIRTSLNQAGILGTEIKTFGEPTDVIIRTIEQAEGTAVGDRIRDALSGNYGPGNFEILRQYKISPKVGKELREGAMYAIFWSLVAIMGYIGLRFKFVYGVGAVLALLHDVLITLGILSLLNDVIPGLNLEITQEVIAAFLTLVGVSVNDTVVVFDRIRENQKIYRSLGLKEIMNRSLNETLSRTVITSGTIFFVLIVLLMMGGEVNRAFAFTMTIGIIVGTYSSIYIASAVVLDSTIRKSLRKA